MDYRENLVSFSQGFLGIPRQDTELCIEKTASKHKITKDEAAEKIFSVIDEKRKTCMQQTKGKTLFGYQENIVSKFYSEHGVIAALATGTGKTLVAVSSAVCAHSISRSFGKQCNILVVTPSSLVKNMEGEFKKSSYDFGEDLKVISSNLFRDVLLYNKRLRNGDRPDADKFMISNTKRRKKEGSLSFVCDKNTFLIVDEAHEFKNDYLYVFAEKPYSNLDIEDIESRARMFVEECYPYIWKVLLLTATPMLNRWYDVMNLIAAVKGVNPEQQSDKVTINFDSTYNIKGTAFSHALSGVESIKYDEINLVDRPYFRNTIVYKDIDKDNRDFPVRNPDIFTVTYMDKDFYGEVLKIIIKLELKKMKTRKKLDEDDEDKDINILQKEISNLPNNPKIGFIKRLLSVSSYGKILVYSRFLNPLNSLKDSINDLIKKKELPFYDIFIITGKDVPPNKRQDYLKKINDSPRSIIFVSDAGGIGLDFKKIECVIIYEPGVNVSREEQAIGRAVRFRSHIDLPIEKQRVDIYKMVLAFPTDVNVAHDIEKGINRLYTGSRRMPLLKRELTTTTPDQKAILNSREKQMSSVYFRHALMEVNGDVKTPLNFRDYFAGENIILFKAD